MKDRNYDDAALGALLDGSIDQITANFDQLTRADLDALRKGEEAGKTRSGLISAIDAQLETLKQEEQAAPPAQPPEQTAGEQGALTEPVGNGVPAGAVAAEGPDAKIYSQAEMDQVVKELNDAHASETARLTDRVSAAEAAAGKAGKAPKQKAGKPIPVQAGADPFDATRKGVVQVVFGDEDGVSFGDAVPPLDFTAGDFEKRGDTAVLKQKVDFGPTAPRAAIASAFLVAGGKAVGRHDFIAPISTGAGAEVTIPEYGMAFSAVAEPAPASEPLAA